MKTVSKVLFDIYRPLMPELLGVSGTSLVTDPDDVTIFTAEAVDAVIGNAPTMSIITTMYAVKEWSGFPPVRVGCLTITSVSKPKYGPTPKELTVEIMAEPGQEAQLILEALKENFK